MMDLTEARRILDALRTGQPLIDRHKAAQALEWALQFACWCQCCHPKNAPLTRMIVCPDCGNKRCPKAFHHLNKCTGSNEPGQAESAVILSRFAGTVVHPCKPGDDDGRPSTVPDR